MRVLSVGYPLFPVSCDASGGAEQILSGIDRELVEHGHESYVVAASGSKVSGRLLAATASDPSQTDQDRQSAQAEHLAIIEQCLRRQSIDVIHFHGLDFHTYLPPTRVPMLATLHLPIDWYPPSIFDLPNVQLNCVSQTQAAGRSLPVIENGVDIRFFSPQGEPDDYLLWLGRICPEKEPHTALRVAHQLSLRLVLAGPVHPFSAHQEYFNQQVRPLLDERRTHVGAVDRKEKRRLLQRARCLVVSSSVAETSSLVSMEALSCGCPVVARSSGALPEVVEHGTTGYVTDSVEEMAEAAQRASRLSRERCRSAAAQRFDSRRMASEYLALQMALTRRAAVPA